MMTEEAILRICGASMIGLALLHLTFPARFRWKEELARLSLLNRQIFSVHCFFVCLVLAMMGLLAAVWPELLLGGGELARIVAWGICIFWTTRLVIQWFGYSRELWRGKPFETMMHYMFTGLWTAYAGIFGWVAWHA